MKRCMYTYNAITALRVDNFPVCYTQNFHFLVLIKEILSWSPFQHNVDPNLAKSN